MLSVGAGGGLGEYFFRLSFLYFFLSLSGTRSDIDLNGSFNPKQANNQHIMLLNSIH